MAFEPGDTLDRYVIVRPLARGGMGQVYEARDTRLRRSVALKVIRIDGEPEARPERSGRLLREARLAAALVHPNVVAVHDVGSIDQAGPLSGTVYIAMELVDGKPLRAFVGDPSVPLETRIRWLKDVASALAAAHARGMVHRDVKPENVMVRDDGLIKVLDFGVAKPDASMFDAPVSARANTTAEGLAVGTPRYMAPEQMRAEEIDGRADQFAWGVLAYELLAGEHPWTAGVDSVQLVAEVFSRDPPPLHTKNSEIPLALTAAVLRALSKSRDRRFSSMTALLDFVGNPALSQARLPSASHADTNGTALTQDELGVRGEEKRVDAPRMGASPAARPRVSGLWIWGGLAALVLAAAVAGELGARRARAVGALAAPPPVASEVTDGPRSAPVLVLILGSQNVTTETGLDGTLDVVLESALTRSRRLLPYAGRALRGLVNEVAPSAAGKDDELGRRVAAAKQTEVARVRLAIAPDGTGFDLSLVAIDGTTGERRADLSARAAGLDRVVQATGELACSLRAALRDEPCAAGVAGLTGLSDSIAADHEYLEGTIALNAGRGDPLGHLRRAVGIDPTFAMAHGALGMSLLNLSRPEEGRAHLLRAIQERDRVSERQGYQLLAVYHAVMDEFDQAVDMYRELLSRWPTGAGYRGNYAAAYSQLGNFEEAIKNVRRAVAENPSDLRARANVPSFLLFADDVEGSARETSAILAEVPHPPPAVYGQGALAEELLGHRERASELLHALEPIDPSGAVESEADVLLYEGRLADAARSLKLGILADEKDAAKASAERKWAMLADTYLRMSDRAHAREAAMHAAKSDEIVTLLSAARALAFAGAVDDASTVERIIAAHPGTRAPLLARIVAMDAGLAKHEPKDALTAALGAPGDGPGSWIAHADLGAAYLAVGAAEDARHELTWCMAHRGRGSNAFYDGAPTLYLIPPVESALSTLPGPR